MARYKSSEEIRKQIAALQVLENEARLREAAEIIARIQVAIVEYKLTPADLGYDASGNYIGPVKATRKPPVQKTPLPMKYTDGTNSWSGRGQVPKWMKEALESGKTREQLLANKPVPEEDDKAA